MDKLLFPVVAYPLITCGEGDGANIEDRGLCIMASGGRIENISFSDFDPYASKGSRIDCMSGSSIGSELNKQNDISIVSMYEQIKHARFRTKTLEDVQRRAYC